MSQNQEQQKEIQEQIQSELSILDSNFDNFNAGSSPVPVASVNSEEKQTKKKRGRPKGSRTKNKNNKSKIPEVIPVESDRVTPLPFEGDYDSNSNSGNYNEFESEPETEYQEEPVYKNFIVQEPLARSISKLLNILFMVLKLPELTEQEKDDLVKLWNGVELPVNKTNEKFFMYLPLIGAGIFTTGIVIERLLKTMKEKNNININNNNSNSVILKQ